ncbi:hypothetical protein [Fructilactobacillus cliffordii]|uniref:Uncharacterized protein n=1 Tax=Fructilactobacillus cliffordii TaxID=2940299 RepID=A0A9Q8ZSY3_9LACO|nr:hypothetical protein [Fructilactobacillus cliffordii]USS89967.1 hypothetical protein M3M40_07205 [Fructilactobacillus cliffordii]
MGKFSLFQSSILGNASKVIVAGDAVSGTETLFHRLATALQIVGFAGGITVGVGCFILMMFLGERKRQSVKDHLTWVIIGIVGLFAMGAIATFFKSYSQGSF